MLAGIAMWVYNLRPERNAEGKLVEGAHASANRDGRPSSMYSVTRDSSKSVQSDWPAALARQSEAHARWTQISLASDRATLCSFVPPEEV